MLRPYSCGVLVFVRPPSACPPEAGALHTRNGKSQGRMSSSTAYSRDLPRNGQDNLMSAQTDELKSLAREFRSALEARLAGDPAGEYRLPSNEDVATFCRRYLDSLFPLHHAPEESSSPQASHFVEELELLLAEQIVCAIRFDCSCRRKKAPANLARAAEELVSKIRAQLPKLAHLQASDLQAALQNDPAATGLEEILLSYPGVEAITVQRLAHELYQLKVPYLSPHDGDCAQPYRN